MKLVDDNSSSSASRTQARREWLARAGVPPVLQDCTPDAWIGDFPENSPGMLYIHGPVGSGKSHLAVATMGLWANALEVGPGVERGHDYNPRSGTRTWERIGALFWDALEAIEALKPGREDEAVEQRLRDAAVLVFDDLGAERGTDFALDRVSLVLRHRYSYELPTIITSNLSPAKLNDVEPRLASRLASGQVVKLSGGDRRLPPPKEANR